jgi:iron complex transport system substrate-binding protein
VNRTALTAPGRAGRALAVVLGGLLTGAVMADGTAPPARIVSLTPHLTELLFAIGAGDRIVATVDFADYPVAARDLPRVGSGARLDLEALRALQPDLVLAWRSGNPLAQVEQVARLGIRVVWSESRRLGDVADELERLGALVGTPRRAAAVAAAYRQRLGRLRARFAERPPVRVFYQFWDQPPMTLNDDHLVGDVLRLCGAVNVFGDLPDLVPRVAVEAVLAADPDVIVIGAPEADVVAWGAKWTAFPGLRAVRAGNVIGADPDLLNRATPRTLDGAQALCAALDQARRRLQNLP